MRTASVTRYGRAGATVARPDEVVKALIWEGDAHAAWEEAVAGGCTIPLWMEVAAARAIDHPEDALPIYRQQVERAIDQKNKRVYA